MKQRVEYLDIAKGLSIVLVVLFHSKLKLVIPEIIRPMALFRVPLFFFLSGVFFSYTLKPKSFILKKSEALLKPYFSILIALSLFIFYSEDGFLLNDLMGIFYGNGDTIRWVPMWFLTHLFALYIFSYILFYFCRFGDWNYKLKYALLCIFISVGLSFVDFFWYKSINLFGHHAELPGLPFSFDIILISSTYFIFGYLLKEKLIEFTPNVAVLILSLAIFFCVIAFTDAHIDLNNRIYNNPLYAALGSFAGIYFMISISWFISKFKWLGFIPLGLGEASLFILIFHPLFGNKVYAILSTMQENLLLVSISSFVLSVIIPILIKGVVDKSGILSLAFYPFKSNILLQRTLYARR